jgi:hypothetical protein
MILNTTLWSWLYSEKIRLGSVLLFKISDSILETQESVEHPSSKCVDIHYNTKKGGTNFGEVA